MVKEIVTLDKCDSTHYGYLVICLFTFSPTTNELAFSPTAAVCLPDTIPASVRNPASVTPSGQVRLGETVTLTCNVPGKPVFNKTRYCVYDQGQYQLVGADYECGRKYHRLLRFHGQLSLFQFTKWCLRFHGNFTKRTVSDPTLIFFEVLGNVFSTS